MNGGHSLVSMLLGNPKMKAHVFDLMRWNYSQPVASLLRSTFPGRIELMEVPHFDWANHPSDDVPCHHPTHPPLL